MARHKCTACPTSICEDYQNKVKDTKELNYIFITKELLLFPECDTDVPIKKFRLYIEDRHNIYGSMYFPHKNFETLQESIAYINKKIKNKLSLEGMLQFIKLKHEVNNENKKRRM